MKNLTSIFVCVITTFASTGMLVSQETESKEKDVVNTQTLIKKSVSRLLEIQQENGMWPYEGVYRVRGKIPVGYRIGGTSIVCTSLLYTDQSDQSEAAILRGVNAILKDLEHRLMKPDNSDRYDVRVWGHIYALDLFCRLHLHGSMMELTELTDPWIPVLVETLITEQINDGGWNYAGQQRHASFVTAPAVQALLLARQTGQEIDDAVFGKARWALENSRTDKGAFYYSGTSGRSMATVPGSVARSPVCEATLMMLGSGNQKNLKQSLADFYEHWDELEKRRKKTGTHEPPYGIAPYYFYYGHRYFAQAISKLPSDEQPDAIDAFTKTLLKTMDEDNTWNDRIFDRSKAYGTAMSVLSLMPDTPVPESITVESVPAK